MLLALLLLLLFQLAGVGTARAFQVSELAGTFAGLALALNRLITSILVPLMLMLWR